MWIGRSTLKFALILFCIPILEADDYESKCDMIAKTYLLWSDSMFGHDATHETSAWIVRNSEGTIEWKRWPASRKWRMETWKGPAPKNLAAQIHTHTVEADPRPSSKDSLLSKKLNVPLYTVSRKGICRKSHLTDKSQELATKTGTQNLV